MKNLLSSFESILPKEITSLVKLLNSKDIRVGFIGGVTRDFLVSNKLSKDIDLEIRADYPIDMKALAVELDAKINEEFQIITIDFSSHSVEIGLPRIESFDKTNLSHKNFVFKHTNGYQEEFLRRDFTVNAIMFEFYDSSITIIDPLDGMTDIKNKILTACSDHFHLDPVRKLRAYRFKINLAFNFSRSLEMTLNHMDIDNCSSFYFQKEASRCNKPLSFLLSLQLIDSFYDRSIYNSSKYSLLEIIQREPSLSNKEELLTKLNLSTKSILPFSKVTSVSDCYEMFKFFIKYNLPCLEVTYILKYAGLNIELYDFSQFEDLDIKFNTKHMSVDQKKNEYIDSILKKILI